MKNYEECTVEKVRKKYPNAKIAGYIKELWQPGQNSFTFDYPGYLRHIEFLKQCDAVVLYNMEMGVFRDMQNKVGTEFSIVTMPIDVDYFYKSFYKQERELSLFCYLPPIHNRRSNTEQFSRYIGSCPHRIPLLLADRVRVFNAVLREGCQSLWQGLHRNSCSTGNYVEHP